MANVITNTKVVTGQKKVDLYITLLSDGTQETATVLYSSSTLATLIGKTNPLNCTIRRLRYIASGSAIKAHLLFDATIDVVALSLPYSGGGSAIEMDFKAIGGLKNTAGSGKTGDILLTTTGLASGDTMTIILTIDPEYT